MRKIDGDDDQNSVDDEEKRSKNRTKNERENFFCGRNK